MTITTPTQPKSGSTRPAIRLVMDTVTTATGLMFAVLVLLYVTPWTPADVRAVLMDLGFVVAVVFLLARLVGWVARPKKEAAS